jgi:hypothetical protein
MVQNYSELYLAVPPPTPAQCRLSPAGGSWLLKSSTPEDSTPNGSGNPVKVTLRLSSSCGKVYSDRMLQSGYHRAAEQMILKMLLCEGEVMAEEHTGLSHFFKV